MQATILTLGVLFLASECIAQVEAEPNNSTSNANILAQGGSVSGDLCDGDIDYFDLQPNVHYKLTVGVTALNMDGVPRHVVVRVMDANDMELDQAQGDGGTWGQSISSTLESLCFTAVGRYLRLTGASTGCVAYTLSVGYSSPPVFSADAEPNEVGFIATPVQLGQAWQGQLQIDSGDIADVFKLTVPSRGYLRFIVGSEWASPHSEQLAFAITDSASGDGFGLSSTIVNVGANGQAIIDTSRSMCLVPGTYYIIPGLFSGGCGVSYNITVDLLQHVFSDDPEPNDDTLTAIPLAPDTWVEGQHHTSVALGVSDMWDYWKIDKPYEGPLVLFTEASDMSGVVYQGEPAVLPISLNDHNGTWIELSTTEMPAIGLLGTVASDTVFIEDAFDAGTYYFATVGSTDACYSYRFAYSSFNLAGIADREDVPFVVAPNPSTSTFRFVGKDMASIAIHDAEGRLVTRFDPRKNALWNAKGNSPGVYIARVTSTNGTIGSARIVLNAE